jgi:hypothetical protein
MSTTWCRYGKGISGRPPSTWPEVTEYLVTPFHLTDALSVFQALVNDVLQSVFVYLE